jgi:hypothetical protein
LKADCLAGLDRPGNAKLSANVVGCSCLMGGDEAGTSRRLTTKLVKRASDDGRISKSKLSNGCKVKFLRSATGYYFGRLPLNCYLGNVGLELSCTSEDEGSAPVNAGVTLDQHGGVTLDLLG